MAMVFGRTKLSGSAGSWRPRCWPAERPDERLRRRTSTCIRTAASGYAATVRNGFLGLSNAVKFFAASAPFSRLRRVDATNSAGSANGFAPVLGFRPWQRNGITFTGNSDQGYIGHKCQQNHRAQRVERPRVSIA
jgi:hypothetical protein